MLLFCKRGRSVWYPTALQVCFQKNHIGVMVYLLNSLLLLRISSHGYVNNNKIIVSFSLKFHDFPFKSIYIIDEMIRSYKILCIFLLCMVRYIFFGIKVINRLIGLIYENIIKMANKIFNVPNHLN